MVSLLIIAELQLDYLIHPRHRRAVVVIPAYQRKRNIIKQPAYQRKGSITKQPAYQRKRRITKQTRKPVWAAQVLRKRRTLAC
jgi:hypothetical protein